MTRQGTLLINAILINVSKYWPDKLLLQFGVNNFL